MQEGKQSEIEKKLNRLADFRKQALAGGGASRIEAQHNKGKFTARERLALLFDKGTFEEIDSFITHRCNDFGMAEQKFPGDSVVTGYGRIYNRQVFAYAQDFTVFGGSLSEVASEKICKVMDMAATNGVPIIGILDSGGARIQEGVTSLDGYGKIISRNILYSGVVPQISVIAGPCAGGAVYSPAITDFIFMVEDTGQMYITGPDVIKTVTGEEITLEQLGGAQTNASKSGNCHFVCKDENECFRSVRRLLTFLPQNCKGPFPPSSQTENASLLLDEEMLNILPDEACKPYDMKRILSRVADNGEIMEVQSKFAPNLIVGFARVGGRSVGILAQQPLRLAGILDVDASDKGARFVRFCDCFNIPLLTFVDVPGYMPGGHQEHKGIIRHGAKLLFAYAEATVPKISVITRKAYGGAYIAMSSKSLRGDINYAWPTAEIAVMGPEGAVNIVCRNEIKRSENPEKTREDLIDKYRERFSSPYEAAARGFIDDIIDPRETRSRIIRALEILAEKKASLPTKKHGNIPL
jgi:propionyl-CoA carboxylase beta chain